MNPIEKLQDFEKQIKDAQGVVENLIGQRIFWARENNKEIKKLYPKKGKIYQLLNPKQYFSYFSSHRHEFVSDSVYYFKPTDVRFFPHRCLDRWSKGTPTVIGSILDCNLKEISTGEKVQIDGLKEIVRETNPKKFQSNFTQVYVMIDKNTGFYKIGRSVNPKQRERTLQSEKPTIELLFNHDARVKDEKQLHSIFNEKRVRGEWFDLNGSDLQTIRQYFNCEEL